MGTPRSAFAHRAFRWVFLGAFASNIGTWMQNVALLAFANQLGGAEYVGIVTFAQLGPMLVLSPFGGVLADAVNRKLVMIVAATIQLIMSIGLAVVASGDHPSKPLIVGLVLTMGIAAAANAPANQATLPALVDRADLAGAVSLNSAQMNASRVLGPLLAVIPFLESTSTVFYFNAATYLFVIAAVASQDQRGIERHGIVEHAVHGEVQQSGGSRVALDPALAGCGSAQQQRRRAKRAAHTAGFSLGARQLRQSGHRGVEVQGIGDNQRAPACRFRAVALLQRQRSHRLHLHDRPRLDRVATGRAVIQRGERQLQQRAIGQHQQALASGDGRRMRRQQLLLQFGG